MILRRTRRGTALATVFAAAAIGAPSAALATAAGPAVNHAPHHAHATVRSYDKGLLKDTNGARSSHTLKHYRMNARLWKIAHTYAEHLAATGSLVHNPNLQKQVTKTCPRWTALGENIAQGLGTNPDDVFQAYMHSPEHKANLLDKHYRQVGIATVTVTDSSGNQIQWNVIDFANNCKK